MRAGKSSNFDSTYIQIWGSVTKIRGMGARRYSEENPCGPQCRTNSDLPGPGLRTKKNHLCVSSSSPAVPLSLMLFSSHLS